MTGIPIGLGVHRDGVEPEFLRSSDDPHGDLAAVGDEHSLFKGRGLIG